MFAAGLASAALAAALAAQGDSRSANSLDRSFVASGRIAMDLSAGEYRITGNPDNHIRMSWSVGDGSQLSSVVARANVSGSEARITTDGPSNHFKVDIQVPSKADLYVRLTAGELRLERVEGSKDVELHAGDLRIDVNRAEDYHTVDASVWAGEIHAAPFHVNQEGLFRSFDWKGSGPYRLHAKLKAGELRFLTRGAE
jgi:hypothetical protein